MVKIQLKTVNCPYHRETTGERHCDKCCPDFRHDWGRKCGDLWVEELGATKSIRGDRENYVCDTSKGGISCGVCENCKIDKLYRDKKAEDEFWGESESFVQLASDLKKQQYMLDIRLERLEKKMK